MYLDSYNDNGGSPFVYPTSGLKSIFESLSRVCSNYGETFKPNKDIDEIIYNDQNKICAIKSNGEIYKCKAMLCNPSYIVRGGDNQKVKRVGKVIRAICILDHPVDSTNNSQSLQIVVPQKQVGRKSGMLFYQILLNIIDIFITVLSNNHQVCKLGHYIAVISTMVETENPEKELKPALDILDPILEKFVTVRIYSIYHALTSI